MKIDEKIFSNISKTLRSDYEKNNEKTRSSPLKDPEDLVKESNQEAYRVTLTLVDKADPAVQVLRPEEAERVAEKLKDMILPNPREAQKAHGNLDAHRVRDLLSD